MENTEYKTCSKCCYDILDDEGDVMQHVCNHTDGDIVDVLSQDFPKVFEQILEHLDNQEK